MSPSPPSPRGPPPQTVEIVIEVPRGGWLKPSSTGELDYVSPLPCPFNYGCVPALPSGDGDPLDAVLLGPSRARGHRQQARVWGIVRFLDAGQIDDKLICAQHPPTRRQRWLVSSFFTVYARAKGALNRLRGRHGPTRMLGLELIE
ncbi:MAG TPA: hypothetical protein ENK18_27845 [Deltaproteobacteria bacterium]|nr:hypothetical protein [Deltaproteobacteria bacterium]